MSLAISREELENLSQELMRSSAEVTDVKRVRFTQKPPPPFVTATLGKACASRFGWSIKDTARASQMMYEQGHISYIRTDSTNLSAEAIAAARAQIAATYGASAMPADDGGRQYATKQKDAQEAHEAIRPAGTTFKTPQDMAQAGMQGDALKLYTLIYERTIASQMNDLVGERTTVTLSARVQGRELTFQTSGRVVIDPGFSAVYRDEKDTEKEAQLPALQEGQRLQPKSTRVTEGQTKAPARYDQASLLDDLIKNGIGRPSTYASIIAVIHDRGYVREDKKKIAPTWSGHATTSLLEQEIPHHVDLKFTARMEADLDLIAQGKKRREEYLREFYSGSNGIHTVTERLAGRGVRVNNPVVKLPQLTEDIKVRMGASGPYVERGDRRALIEGTEPNDITDEIARRILETGKPVPDANKSGGYQRNVHIIGTDPSTGKEVTVREGRYGPYVQMGESSDPEVRRGSVPQDIDITRMDLRQATLYLDLNRVIGLAPDGDELRTGLGRYGPYLKKGDKFRSITLEEARALDVASAVALWNTPRPKSNSTPPATRKQGPRR